MNRASIGLFAGLAVAIAACSGGRPLPKGPPPEYEEPPMPSWMRDAGTGSAIEPSRALDAPDAG